MKTPRITCCCDGCFRHVIHGVGPYIADYPEQALLVCIVQGWCLKYVFFSWLLGLVTYDTWFAIQLRCTTPHHDLKGEIRSPHLHFHTETLMSPGTNHTARTLGQLQDCGGHLGEYFFNLLLGVCLTMVLNALANYNSFPTS